MTVLYHFPGQTQERVRAMCQILLQDRLARLKRRPGRVPELSPALVGWVRPLVMRLIPPMARLPALTRIRGQLRGEWYLCLVVLGRLV